jgi:hypothetical protein
MPQLKFGILGLGVLGLIAVFLPLVSAGELSISLWDARKADAGQVYLTMGAFLIPAVMGGIAIAQKKLLRYHGIVATIGFAIALLKVRDAFKGAIGGKLMFVAAILGLLVAIAAIAKPEDA